jgi:hypothetical protein
MQFNEWYSALTNLPSFSFLIIAYKFLPLLFDLRLINRSISLSLNLDNQRVEDVVCAYEEHHELKD